MTTLTCTRRPGETWKDSVRRLGRAGGRERECIEAFNVYVRGGMDEGAAAWSALNDFGCLAEERTE